MPIYPTILSDPLHTNEDWNIFVQNIITIMVRQIIDNGNRRLLHYMATSIKKKKWSRVEPERCGQSRPLNLKKIQEELRYCYSQL